MTSSNLKNKISSRDFQGFKTKTKANSDRRCAKMTSTSTSQRRNQYKTIQFWRNLTQITCIIGQHWETTGSQQHISIRSHKPHADIPGKLSVPQYKTGKKWQDSTRLQSISLLQPYIFIQIATKIANAYSMWAPKAAKRPFWRKAAGYWRLSHRLR